MQCGTERPKLVLLHGYKPAEEVEDILTMLEFIRSQVR